MCCLDGVRSGRYWAVVDGQDFLHLPPGRCRGLQPTGDGRRRGGSDLDVDARDVSQQPWFFEYRRGKQLLGVCTQSIVGYTVPDVRTIWGAES